MIVHDRMLRKVRSIMKPMYSGETIAAPLYVYPAQLEDECRRKIVEALAELDRKEMVSEELDPSFMDAVVDARFNIIKNRICHQTIQHDSFIKECKRKIRLEIERLEELLGAINVYHQKMVQYSGQFRLKNQKTLFANLVTSIRKNGVDRKIKELGAVREKLGCSVDEMRRLHESVKNIEGQDAVERKKIFDFANEKQEEAKQDVRNLIQSIIQKEMTD